MQHDNSLTQRVIGCAIEVHRTLGPGLLETVYEVCLCRELALAGISFVRQQKIPVIYKSEPVDCDLRIDVVVEQSLALEIKAVQQILPVHEAQLLTDLRIGSRIRCPDVLVSAEPLDQTIHTVTDAVAIFEVLFDDTAATDRIEKPIDYAAVPSLRTYVALEQAHVGATVFHRVPGAAWTATPLTEGAIDLHGLGVRLPLADLYKGLTFSA